MSPIRNGTFLSLSLCTNSIEKNRKNSQTLFLYTKYKTDKKYGKNRLLPFLIEEKNSNSQALFKTLNNIKILSTKVSSIMFTLKPIH